MADTDESLVRDAIVTWGRSLFERSLTSGSSGNISVRVGDAIVATPTNSCLGFLKPNNLSKVSLAGEHLSGDAPTKELPLHLTFYHKRSKCGAVVHLHSTFATALSCLEDTPSHNAIPPITPYVVMRAGAVPVLPYRRPGSVEAGDLVAHAANDHSAVLIANHGPIASGVDLPSAVFAIEEIEEAAKLVILTKGMNVRLLDQAAVDELNSTFKYR
jgi:ribulose-5-phosphate 4-epimerase/fuculose-1-phosphate aldolase